MTLQEDLKKLSVNIRTLDSDEFKNFIDELKKKYTTKEDWDKIDAFVCEDMRKLRAETDQLLHEITIREQLQEVSEIVSFSYIAKKYFNKTRQWLYQRINANEVNGKPVRFTEKELETFNFALQDISKKIGSIKVSAT